MSVSKEKATIDRRSSVVAPLTVFAAAAALGLAACGGGSRPPHVASLGASTSVATSIGDSTSHTGGDTGGGSATTASKGDPARLLEDWATCMHSHGDPDQADPTIDAYGVIQVTLPTDAQNLSNEVHAGADPCDSYMASAENALRAANPVAPPPDQSEQIKYVNCMRANGVPNYPYPNGNSTNFNGTGVDPNSPDVESVNNLCGSKLHLPGWWVSGTGPPGDVVVTSGGGPGGGAPPEGGSSPNGGQLPVRVGNGGANGIQQSGTGA